MEILNTIFAMDEFKDALPNLFERSANDNLIALISSITKATLTTSDNYDRVHRIIFRLQPDMPVFFVKSLDRCGIID